MGQLELILRVEVLLRLINTDTVPEFLVRQVRLEDVKPALLEAALLLRA